MRKWTTDVDTASRLSPHYSTLNNSRGISMKLYMHPVSTVCRPIRLFCAENGIKIEEVTGDLMTGAQHKEPFASLNPSRQVPLLEDGDLRLTEASAILK